MSCSLTERGSYRTVSTEWAKFWLRDGVEHLHAHYVTHAFTPHTHEGYVIATIEGGAQAFRYRGRVHRATPGHVTFINPGEVHTGNAATEQGWRYRPLYPSVERLRRGAEEIFSAAAEPYFADAVVYDPDLAARVRRYHLVSELGGDLAREEAFLELITCAVARYANGPFRPRRVAHEPAAVKRVRDYLEAHVCANATLAELAHLTGLSPYAVMRAFRQQTGLTPHGYQVQRRVEAAKRRLRAGESIAAVATETGFFDQSHLGKHFKRIVGVTPHTFLRGTS